LASRPEVQLQVVDFMVVIELGGFGEELALDGIVLVRVVG
jgi:hypothetical protein